MPGARRINVHLKNVPARRAAEELARKAGLVLANPGVLTMAPVSFDFAGMKAVLEGRQVRLVHQ